jgi:hypothetical protein
MIEQARKELETEKMIFQKMMADFEKKQATKEAITSRDNRVGKREVRIATYLFKSFSGNYLIMLMKLLYKMTDKDKVNEKKTQKKAKKKEVSEKLSYKHESLMSKKTYYIYILLNAVSAEGRGSSYRRSDV